MKKISDQQRKSALYATSILIQNMLKNNIQPYELFGNKQNLLGFQIGWLKKNLHEKVCIAVGVNPAECEIVLMHAHSRTECHMHKHGASTFLVLGEEHGMGITDGGILTAEYQVGVTKYHLAENKAFPGQIVEVPAGQIHSFYANKQDGLSALGFVYPKIRTGKNEFDVIEYVFTDGNSVELMN